MKNRMIRWLRSTTAVRRATLMFATGLVAIGADAAISHFAGREMKSAFQLVPVIAAPLGLVGLGVLAIRRSTERRFRIGLRIAAALIAAVGALGTVFHGLALVRLIEGQALTMKSLELALAVAPPIGAPGAFIALGGLLWLLASPRLVLDLRPREHGSAAHAPAAA